MAALIIVGTIAALSALGLVASRWGVDSRDGFSDPDGFAVPVSLR